MYNSQPKQTQTVYKNNIPTDTYYKRNAYREPAKKKTYNDRVETMSQRHNDKTIAHLPTTLAKKNHKQKKTNKEHLIPLTKQVYMSRTTK